MSGKRGPKVDSFGPVNGFGQNKLIWSRINIKSPGRKRGLMPPAAFVTIKRRIPSLPKTRIGNVTAFMS